MSKRTTPFATITAQGTTGTKKELAPLYDRSRFGTLEKETVILSSLETLYLVEREKLVVKEGRKKLGFDALLAHFLKEDTRIWVRYAVFRDLRDAGYVVKTAVKFGADFRVYDKGVKPGEDHAKWVVFPVKAEDMLSWQEFSAKNRVANSTKKKLLIAVLDAESDITYYEVRWTKP